MIVKKTWERYVEVNGVKSWRTDTTTYRDTYTGWFLFGIIPLFIVRDRTRPS